MLDTIDAGPKEAERFFNQWVSEVKATVPKERLLEFSVKEGWEPLCKFLGKTLSKQFISKEII